MSPSPRSLLHERGAALVEAALILPLFFALVLGMITFGDAYFTRISLEDAVRDGARFAATFAEFDSDGVHDPDNYTDDEWTVVRRIEALSGGELIAAGDDDEICVELVTVPDTFLGDATRGWGAGETCGVDDPDGSDGDKVVKVSAKTGVKIEYIFNAFDFDITAHSAAFYEAGTS